MKKKQNILIAFLLNLLFSIIEFIGGIFTGSLAITSDALHDLGDASTIGLAYFLEKKSDKPANNTFTYGYRRYSLLGGIITNVILFTGSFFILYNGILKLNNPTLIKYDQMLILAFFGLAVNLVATYFTHGGHSINQKAINLHMLEDVFGWIIVLIGGIVIKYTNLYIIDPIMSILLAIFIIYHSSKNLKEILDLFLIKTPKEVNIEVIKEEIMNISNVKKIHNLRVWSLDGKYNLATITVQIIEKNQDTKLLIREILRNNHISQETIETTEDDFYQENSFIANHYEHHHAHHHP